MANSRIVQFEGLRAIAFTSVFLFHTVHLPLGYVGVDLFFVLSGFLITRNLIALRETTTTSSAFGSFFYRRLLRILPPYYAVVAVLIALSYIPSHEAGWYLSFTSNIRDSVKPTLEGPQTTFWSICVEEQFYLVWPFVVLLIPRRALVPVISGAIVAALFVRWALSGNDDAVYRLTISRMDCLGAGSLLALVEAKKPFALHRMLRPALAIGALAIGAFGALYAQPGFRYYVQNPLYDTVGYALTTAVCTCLLVAVYCAPPAFLSNRVLRYIGMISYAAYLWHPLVLDQVHRLHLRGPATAVVAYAFTLLVASASWYLLEQPLQRFRDRVKPERVRKKLRTTVLTGPRIAPATF
ncbi:MAG: acyltransferase [Kofleriaceae bacterium]